MIKISEAEFKFQRCQSCDSENVARIQLGIEEEGDMKSSQSIHLCETCIDALAIKIIDFQFPGSTKKPVDLSKMEFGEGVPSGMLSDL